MGDRLSYGVDEVAKMVGCSITTVFKLIREKKLPAKKLGGRTIVLADDLREFLRSLPSVAGDDL